MDLWKGSLPSVHSNEPQAEVLDVLRIITPNSAASELLHKALVTHALLVRLGFTETQAVDALRSASDVGDVDVCMAWLVGILSDEEMEAVKKRSLEHQGSFVSEPDASEQPELSDDRNRPPRHSGFTFERRISTKADLHRGSQGSYTPPTPPIREASSPVPISLEGQRLITDTKAFCNDLLSKLGDLQQIDTLEDPIGSYGQARLYVIQIDKKSAAFEKQIKYMDMQGTSASHEVKQKLQRTKIAAQKAADECQYSPTWNVLAGENGFQRLKLEWEAQDNTNTETADDAGTIPTCDVPPTPSEQSDRSEEADEGGMFGGMLDEEVGEVEDKNSHQTIYLRELPSTLLKSQGSRTPRAMLIESLRRLDPSSTVRFESIPTSARWHRSRLTLRWYIQSHYVEDDYTMTSMATLSQASADDLLAIAALYCVDTRSAYRSLSGAWRDWWSELDLLRQGELNALRRSQYRTMVEGLAKRLQEEHARDLDPPHKNKTAATLKDSNEDVTLSTPEPSGSRHDEAGKALWSQREQSAKFQQMLMGRNALPVAAQKEHIVETFSQNQVIVLSGETGCGKSTQVPAYIMESCLLRGEACKIYVTEPRRISAISLAERVSQEIGEDKGVVGKDHSLIGSAVRLENNIGKNARLVFATTGIVLRMLEGSKMEDITHIVVDEVHERSIESDFLLIILKNLIAIRKDLKVVLMSATLDAERISEYFGGCPTINVPGRTFPVEVQWLEDVIELCDYTLEDSSRYAKGVNWRRNVAANKFKSLPDDDVTDDTLEDDGQEESKLTGAGRYQAKTISTLNRMDEYTVNHELIIALVEKMCFGPQDLQQYSSAILIFLPGLADIRQLHDLFLTHRMFGSESFQVWPLHSTISNENQSLVFEFPPKGVRKIVLSTNIAETGITIPDITCVIDSGKHREMRFDEKRQMSKLLECFIARSNAKQRRGRAGRVQSGICWHLFTKYRHDNLLAEHPIPEMLRLSLQDLSLKLKVMKVQIGKSIEEALSQALDPPSSTNVQRSVTALIDIKALTTTEEITPLGRQLSRLPLDVNMGKLLLMACSLGILDSALTIAATMNAKSPFLTPFGQELEARLAKKSFDKGNNDFVTIVRAFNSWRKATENGNARKFCKQSFLSQTNLVQIEELRQQYMTYLIDAGFVDVDRNTKHEITGRVFRFRSAGTRFMRVPSQYDTNSANLVMLNTAIAAALYPKLLVIDGQNGTFRTLTNNAPAVIHPSSVNFKVKVDQLPQGFHHFVYYSIMQSRRLFAWETAAVDNRALLVLCGEADFKFSAPCLLIDRQRLRFTVADVKNLMALKILRMRLAKILQGAYRNP